MQGVKLPMSQLQSINIIFACAAWVREMELRRALFDEDVRDPAIDDIAGRLGDEHHRAVDSLQLAANRAIERLSYSPRTRLVCSLVAP